MPVESPPVFYPRFVFDAISKHLRVAKQIWHFGRFRQQLKRDPQARDYMDLALTPVVEDEFDSFEMFSNTDAAKSAVIEAHHPSETHAAPKSALVHIDH